jgi:hypothetical protein
MWNCQAASIPMLDDVSVIILSKEWNGVSTAFNEWIFNVVNARFGEEVFIILVDEAAYVSWRYDNLLIEH